MRYSLLDGKKKNPLPKPQTADVARAERPTALSQVTIQRALNNPHRLTPPDVLMLQRVIGNRAMTRLLTAGRPASGGMQVGAADTPMERQADQVAQQVAPRAASSSLQRSTASESLPATLPFGSQGGRTGSRLSGEIQRAMSGGRPVPEPVRGRVEQTTGANLTGVRVHDDPHAHKLSADLDAEAFTHKNHIFLGKGRSPNDAQLMAHELTHTIQQRQGNRDGRTGSTATAAPGMSAGIIQRKTQNLHVDKRLRQKYSSGTVNAMLKELRAKVDAYNKIPQDDPNYTGQLQLLQDIKVTAESISRHVDSWDFLSGGARSLGGPFRYPYFMLIRNLVKLAGYGGAGSARHQADSLGVDVAAYSASAIVPREISAVRQQMQQEQGGRGSNEPKWNRVNAPESMWGQNPNARMLGSRAKSLSPDEMIDVAVFNRLRVGSEEELNDL